MRYTFPMFNKDSLHHAYFIEGGTFEDIESELHKIKFNPHGNPDFWRLETENLTIDDARVIKDLQSQKPIAGERRVFVVETFSMTKEAQNALLKVFEEPTAGALFIIIAPSAHILLPTLRSRMVVVSDRKRAPERLSPIDPKKFIQNPPAKRIEMFKPILEYKDVEGNKKADKKAAAAFLLALREECGIFVSRMSERSEFSRDEYAALEAIDQALFYLFDRSSSVKLLLETVALSIPEKI